ncbi:MAG: hypothetical protein R3B93_03185 [Bacteroidia bacterium]
MFTWDFPEKNKAFTEAALRSKPKYDAWDIIGILNNDMIGNIEGIDGVIDNRSFRIFSEPTCY